MWVASYKLPERFYLNFFNERETFWWGGVFMGRPTHDWLVTLRQTSRFSPRGECEEAGRPGPPLLFFPSRHFELFTLQDPPSKNLRMGHPSKCLINSYGTKLNNL